MPAVAWFRRPWVAQGELEDLEDNSGSNDEFGISDAPNGCPNGALKQPPVQSFNDLTMWKQSYRGFAVNKIPPLRKSFLLLKRSLLLFCPERVTDGFDWRR